MTPLETAKAQQLNLLARKALLTDELKAVEAAVGQTAAVIKALEAVEGSVKE